MKNTPRKLGKLGYKDSGPVSSGASYTTIVVVHGFGWSSGVFSRIEPFMAQEGVRLVLVNRRDFPGAEPYTEKERTQLAIAQSSPDALDILQGYMCERAGELYDFLSLFVKQENIPPVGEHCGGIILVAWSFGSTWLMALLANITKFTAGNANLCGYIRRTILYDPPCHSLGYPLPEEKYHPLEDDTIPPETRALAFSRWVSGYYTHGDSPSTLQLRTPEEQPLPSIITMSPLDLQTNFFPEIAGPGGSDLLLLNATLTAGVNAAVRKQAFFLATEGGNDDWGDIELRYLWCDRSVYEVPWGTWALRKEMDEAQLNSRRMRNIKIARLVGANHFAHWDDPARLSRALISEDLTLGVD